MNPTETPRMPQETRGKNGETNLRIKTVPPPPSQPFPSKLGEMTDTGSEQSFASSARERRDIDEMVMNKAFNEMTLAEMNEVQQGRYNNAFPYPKFRIRTEDWEKFETIYGERKQDEERQDQQRRLAFAESPGAFSMTQTPALPRADEYEECEDLDGSAKRIIGREFVWNDDKYGDPREYLKGPVAKLYTMCQGFPCLNIGADMNYKFVTLGRTSAGKSMLVNVLLQNKVAFSGFGIGTRCLVEYTSINNPDFDEEQYTVKLPGRQERKTTDVNEAHSRIATRMQELNDDEKFSSDIIYFTIEGPNVANMTILDVPGIVPNKTNKDQEAVICVIRKALKGAVLLVIRENEEPANDVCISEFQKKVFYGIPDWRAKYRPIFIVNKMDTGSENLLLRKNGSKLLARMDRACEVSATGGDFGTGDFYPTIFVMLKPETKDDEEMDAEYIRSIPDIEAKRWEPVRPTVQGTRHVNSLGIMTIYKVMANFVREETNELVGHVIRGGLGEVIRRKEEVDACETHQQPPFHDVDQTNEEECEGMRIQYIKWMDRFVEQFLQEQRNFHNDYTKCTTIPLDCAEKLGWNYITETTHANNYGSGEQEYRKFQDKLQNPGGSEERREWVGIIRDGRVLREKAHEHNLAWKRELDVPLFGKAAMRRVQKVFSFALALMPKSEFSEPEYYDTKYNAVQHAGTSKAAVFANLRKVNRQYGEILFEWLVVRLVHLGKHTQDIIYDSVRNMDASDPHKLEAHWSPSFIKWCHPLLTKRIMEPLHRVLKYNGQLALHECRAMVHSSNAAALDPESVRRVLATFECRMIAQQGQDDQKLDESSVTHEKFGPVMKALSHICCEVAPASYSKDGYNNALKVVELAAEIEWVKWGERGINCVEHHIIGKYRDSYMRVGFKNCELSFDSVTKGTLAAVEGQLKDFFARFRLPPRVKRDCGYEIQDHLELGLEESLEESGLGAALHDKPIKPHDNDKLVSNIAHTVIDQFREYQIDYLEPLDAISFGEILQSIRRRVGEDGAEAHLAECTRRYAEFNAKYENFKRHAMLFREKPHTGAARSPSSI